MLPIGLSSAIRHDARAGESEREYRQCIRRGVALARDEKSFVSYALPHGHGQRKDDCRHAPPAVAGPALPADRRMTPGPRGYPVDRSRSTSSDFIFISMSKTACESRIRKFQKPGLERMFGSHKLPKP